jgi:hypothetical protein
MEDYEQPCFKEGYVEKIEEVMSAYRKKNELKEIKIKHERQILLCCARKSEGGVKKSVVVASRFVLAIISAYKLQKKSIKSIIVTFSKRINIMYQYTHYVKIDPEFYYLSIFIYFLIKKNYLKLQDVLMNILWRYDSILGQFDKFVYRNDDYKYLLEKYIREFDGEKFKKVLLENINKYPLTHGGMNSYKNKSREYESEIKSDFIKL